MSTPAVADPLESLVRFAAALRERGLSVDAARVAVAAEAIVLLGSSDLSAVYRAARATFCRSPDDLVVFDDVFRRWVVPVAVDPPGVPGDLARHADEAGDTGDANDGDDPGNHAAGTDVEFLRSTELRRLTAEQRREVDALIAGLRPVPERRSLRRRGGGRDQIDVDAAFASMMRDGGELWRIPRDRPRGKRRRVVVLVDVSGSMATVAETFLRFGHAAVRAAPADAEVFALGTRLTRLTRELQARDPQAALDLAARAVADWGAGTRLSEGLADFLDRWGRRGTARRAVVVVFTDGLASGDATPLGAQLDRLRRLAHVVVWANQHASRLSYRPLGPGPEAMAEHTSHLVPAGTYDSLVDLAALIGQLSYEQPARDLASRGRRASGPVAAGSHRRDPAPPSTWPRRSP